MPTDDFEPWYNNDNTNLDVDYNHLNLSFKWSISPDGRWIHFFKNVGESSIEDYHYELPTVWTKDAVKLLPETFHSEVAHYRKQYLKDVELRRSKAESLADEIVNFGKKIVAPVDYKEEDMEDTGFQYDLTASYEVNYSPMSDGYDDYDTYKIKLKLESEDPDFIVQPELELDLTMHNKGKLEQLLKLIDTVFDLGKYNSENYLCIDAKSIETSDLEL
jgi:hypothetical protein